MIKIQNLSKVFRTEELETKALNEISLEINEGEFVTIMGASGCGKSTLLNIVGLLDNASSGSYKLLNQEINSLNESERSKIRKQNIGFVFQNFNLIDELSVYDNIELPLIYNNINASERKKKVEAIAERLAISHRLKHFPQQLSGGQQQRVAIARTLMQRPSLLLADEPVASLDPESAAQVMDVLFRIVVEDQLTVICTLHQVELALGWAQRIVGLRDGQVVLDRAVDNLDQEAVMDVYRRVEPGQKVSEGQNLTGSPSTRVS